MIVANCMYESRHSYKTCTRLTVRGWRVCCDTWLFHRRSRHCVCARHTLCGVVVTRGTIVASVFMLPVICANFCAILTVLTIQSRVFEKFARTDSASGGRASTDQDTRVAISIVSRASIQLDARAAISCNAGTTTIQVASKFFTAGAKSWRAIWKGRRRVAAHARVYGTVCPRWRAASGRRRRREDRASFGSPASVSPVFPRREAFLKIESHRKR